jgi:hypothetical protein
MSVTSIVSFITNDKLKVFIKEVQDNFKELLEETYISRGERNFESILDTQYIIRQYLIENQERIDFSNAGFVLKDRHAKSMPSLFGLYMMVVSDLTKIQTIEDVMKQIEKRHVVLLGEKVELGVDASGVVFDATELHEDKLCCCSHTCHIENLAVIKNQFTNYCIVVGSECIHKNKLVDRDVMLREQKKTVKYIEKKKIADKIKEEKKRMKEDEKRRKIEEEREAYIQEQKKEDERRRKIEEERDAYVQKQREAYAQEQIRKRMDREEFDKRQEETRIESKEKERLYIEKYGRSSNDTRSFFGNLYNKPVEKPAVRKFIILEPRTYLDVTFAKKDKAKEMGAFYDVNYKKWCIRPYCRNPQGLLKEYKVIPDPRKN